MFTVDLGFSSAKWLKDNKRGRIKSVYRESQREDGLLFNGTRYVLGERALLQTGSYYLRTMEEIIGFYPLFVAYAAEKAEIKGDNILIVGLPFDFWQMETEKRKKGAVNKLTELEESLREIAINDNVYAFDKVYVFPQGLGCIKAFLYDKKDIKGNILGIDIGFNTVIYTLYSVDEKELLYGKTLYKKGVLDMADNHLRFAIERYVPAKSFTAAEINHIMETGKIQIGFDQVDMTPDITVAVEKYTHKLLSTIVGDLRENAGVVPFDTVVFAGGGARLLTDVTASKVNVHIMKEPEFANAIGFRVAADEIIGQP